MHKIILHRNVVKFYRKADKALKERLADAFDAIARNPHLGGCPRTQSRKAIFCQKSLQTDKIIS